MKKMQQDSHGVIIKTVEDDCWKMTNQRGYVFDKYQERNMILGSFAYFRSIAAESIIINFICLPVRQPKSLQLQQARCANIFLTD